MSTRPYVVRQGDCFISLAARHGVTVDDLRNHDMNSSVREHREDPSVLAAGDVVHVPATPPARPSIQAGGNQRFKAYGATTPLVLDIHDPGGKKMAGRAYRLRVGSRVIEGRANGEGRIETRVPTSARTAELIVWPSDSREEHHGKRWILHLGHMDPAEGNSGTAARLENLGIHVSPAPGGLEAALRTFQQLSGLEATGTLDEQTRDALRSAAGV